jgi:outer membrane protein OmpA-like peptidoglycan-associated protein
MRRLVVMASLAALTACSSPPKPPTVDGSNREGINSPQVAENLALRLQLEQAQQRLKQRPVAPVPLKAIAPAPASRTITVTFPYNDTHFRPSGYQLAELMPLVGKAKRVEIRGRTDAKTPSDADAKIAMQRAMSAQRYLISQGVPASMISINYVSAGDYVSDNETSIGRSLNRRVDIEVFRGGI